MITVHLKINKIPPECSEQRIESYRTISDLKKAVEYISKYPDVRFVELTFRDKEYEDLYYAQ